MSSNVCSACKHASTCTFPRNVIVVQCEEYEYAEPEEKTPKEQTSEKLGALDIKREAAAVR
ncbi:MAG: hypothetical protein QHI38_00435 [Armatimonadota bacterium]|nr:hypothetical protein [Armatimonadota bacterium]